jgi:hypothetical protein
MNSKTGGEGLRDFYQRFSFFLGAPTVLGGDEWIGSIRKNLCHSVNLLGVGDDRNGGKSLRNNVMGSSEQQVEGYLKQRRTEWSGFGDETCPAKFVNQGGGRTRSLGPLLRTGHVVLILSEAQRPAEDPHV